MFLCLRLFAQDVVTSCSASQTYPITCANCAARITNAFRAAWAYGQGVPSEAKVLQIMEEVYAKFPAAPEYEWFP